MEACGFIFLTSQGVMVGALGLALFIKSHEDMGSAWDPYVTKKKEGQYLITVFLSSRPYFCVLNYVKVN